MTWKLHKQELQLVLFMLLCHIGLLIEVSCFVKHPRPTTRQVFCESGHDGDDKHHHYSHNQHHQRHRVHRPRQQQHHHHQDSPATKRLHSRAVYMAYDHSRINSSESLSSSWFYQQDQPAILDQCCACDEAKYELVFEGLWSKYTHPDDFPENYWLAYFSDIIGASHSNDFRMWAQDSLASEGVRELAESGATKKLESELKHVSSKTRTIIKARELRYPTLNSKTSAVFRTDKLHHLVSILSKLGPSPDWMVGVSSLELCQSDCTWAPQRVVNLYLWDAGTDCGTQFTSSDQPCQPPERIHPYERRRGNSQRAVASNGLHSTQGGPALRPLDLNQTGASMSDSMSMSHLPPLVPDDGGAYAQASNSNQQSQLSGPSMGQEQMKPFARLTVTRQRIYEKSCNNNINNVAANNNNNSGNYNVDSLSSFTRDSSFNQYNKQHHSDHLHPTINSDSLIEPPARASYSDCRFTEWSDWSSCSSQCGKGIRTRTRSFLDDQAHIAGCSQADLIEKEICLAECVGNTSCVTRDWSEWSKCSVDCGQGYRKRTRAPIGNGVHFKAACANIDLAEMEQCTSSSGCGSGGGSSNGDQEPDNYNNTGQSVGGLHCAVGEWSQWSECSVACGRGTRIRTRQFMRQEDAEHCTMVRLLQKQPCQGRPELCKQVAPSSKAMRRNCMLPADPGLCLADIDRWYYDRELRRCKRFTFGGCAGNANNFFTFQECRRACDPRNQSNSSSDKTNSSL